MNHLSHEFPLILFEYDIVLSHPMTLVSNIMVSLENNFLSQGTWFKSPKFCSGAYDLDAQVQCATRPGLCVVMCLL